MTALGTAMGSPAAGSMTPNRVVAWGLNSDGQLGNGTTESTAVPVQVSALRGVGALAGGSHYSLALLEGGSVMAWGRNSSGQLGNGSTANSDVPVAVSGVREVVALAAGENHSLALLRSGAVLAWGKNGSGQLGDGGTTNSDVAVPVSGLTEVAAISAGGSFSLALLKNGTVMAWGENFYGQLGDGTTEASTVPVPVSSLSSVIAVSAGFRHSLALLSDGTAVAWGDNTYGQLGDGGEAGSDLPVAVRGLKRVSGISAGHSHSLALVSTGGVMAWGDNEKGQLGDGSRTGPEQCGAPAVFACGKRPAPVIGLDAATAISAGAHSLALLSDGSAVAWGPNTAGQLGDGLPTGPEPCAIGQSCSTTPVQVCSTGVQIPCVMGRGLSNVGAVAAGEAHSMAVVELPQLPELGRCVKVSSGGAYTGSSARCIAISPAHKGHFEWLPGPGLKNKFSEHLSSPQLETVGRGRLSCATAVLEGGYAGPKAETIDHLILQGCRDVTRNMSCQTAPLESGRIESSLPLEAVLGFITSVGRPRVGWELKPKPPATSLVSFQCGAGASAVALSLEGSVIGRAAPVNRMVLTFELLYKQKGGRQIPEAFEGRIPATLTLFSAPLGTPHTAEQAGLAARGTRTSEEELEIKTKS